MNKIEVSIIIGLLFFSVGNIWVGNAIYNVNGDYLSKVQSKSFLLVSGFVFALGFLLVLVVLNVNRMLYKNRIKKVVNGVY